MSTRKTLLMSAAPLILALAASPALAQSTGTQSNTTMDKTVTPSTTMDNSARMNQPAMNDRTATTPNRAAGQTQARVGDPQDAKELVNEAVKVVGEMKQDKDLWAALQKAKGVFILPDFGRGALGVGARGGAGVVLTKHNGRWSSPAFFDLGGISIGAQVGGSGGAVAFLLMTDNAVNNFKSGNKFSLNADAGISIIDWSAAAQASWGKGDIILWSDTKGAFAGAAVSVTDINWDDDNNKGYYGPNVTASQILSGQVTADTHPLAKALPNG